MSSNEDDISQSGLFERNGSEASQERAPEVLLEASATAEMPEQSLGKKSRRPRVQCSFPASSFTEALPLAEAIQKFAAGQKIRRLTLFDHLGRSPESGSSRQLITNSNQYGITIGGYSAEYLELTDEGRIATAAESPVRARLAARFQLAIAGVSAFNRLYEQYNDNRLPVSNVLKVFVVEQAIAPTELADECVETFLANAKDLGLLRPYAGAERLLTFETLLELMEDEFAESEADSTRDHVEPPASRDVAVQKAPASGARSTPAIILAESSDVSNVCFLISPIGDVDSIQRKHADLVYGSLIEPALVGLDLRLVRADKISKPGMITGQIIDHVVRAPLLIADLSFGNPNVFYELALRHASRRPMVQIIRIGDRLPFDVGQFRTVQIDMTDIFTLVPQIDTYRSEISRQCRAALQEDHEAESPLSQFYPGFWDQFHVRD